MLLQIEQETGVTPKALLSRPRLSPAYRHLLEAFYEVSSGREVGEFPQAITAGEILHYCTLMGVTGLDERESLFRAIRSLDAAYLTHVASKRPKVKN